MKGFLFVVTLRVLFFLPVPSEAGLRDFFGRVFQKAPVRKTIHKVAPNALQDCPGGVCPVRQSEKASMTPAFDDVPKVLTFRSQSCEEGTCRLGDTYTVVVPRF
jgi:hypothetical protein